MIVDPLTLARAVLADQAVRRGLITPGERDGIFARLRIDLIVHERCRRAGLGAT